MAKIQNIEAEPVSSKGLTSWQRGAFFAGPIVGIIAWLSLQALGLDGQPALTAGIATWVALWWVFEPISIPATSMIPFVAFPAAGVLSNKEVAQAYGHWLISSTWWILLSAGMEKAVFIEGLLWASCAWWVPVDPRVSFWA